VLTVVTANVNGIRAAQRRGGVDWLAAAAPDLICLQEVRASDEQLVESLEGSGLQQYSWAHAECSEKGRAGVAILSRMPPTAVRIGLGVTEFDDAGRWIEVDVPTSDGPITVISTYVHTGEASDPVRQDQKYRFLDGMHARMATLSRRSARGKGEAVLCGDFNVAHTEQDIKNWKGNRGKAGFLEDERAYLDRWRDELGWVDLGRVHGGPGPGPYTWWSWRGRGFDTDGGWRIDYVMTTKRLAQRATGVEVGKAAAYAQRWSDHAPVTATFDHPGLTS
jgi:exodeoxyribonuclease-3